jgi:outer membrane protein assembly factor BamB
MWRYDTGHPNVSPPIIDGDAIYFGSRDDNARGHIYALDPRSGEDVKAKLKFLKIANLEFPSSNVRS